MHRNTYLFISLLAIIAALLIGINLGKILTKSVPVASSETRPTPTTKITLLTYTDTFCGFSLVYPSTFQVLENASGSAILHMQSDTAQAITLICQKNIPIPAGTSAPLSLPTTRGASISAKLYTDTTATVEAVLFHHPTNGMAVGLFVRCAD